LTLGLDQNLSRPRILVDF